MAADDNHRSGGLGTTITKTDLAPMGPDPDLVPAGLSRGAAFGRYLVLERLGSGGMGVVYSAYDPELDRKIAVKILKPEVVQDQHASAA